MRENEITPEPLYLRRRDFLAGSVAAGVCVAAGSAGLLACGAGEASAKNPPELPTRTLDAVPGPAALQTDEPRTPYEDATRYNNFYEFGTDKTDPARYAGSLRPEPWSVVVEGEVEKPGRVPLEDLLRNHDLEERVYRLRCVEAWSMVIPWIGIPLGDVIRRLQPTSKARYVAFETLYDPEQMPGQKRRVLDWPYREGLRMDEAMHPLAILGGGHVREGAAQPERGAPAAGGAVEVRLQEHQVDREDPAAGRPSPHTSWNMQAPREYGFYANVNPEVDHPRWSQARERRIGDLRRRPTLPFNGYAEQVASLYAGMDLRKNF